MPALAVAGVTSNVRASTKTAAFSWRLATTSSARDATTLAPPAQRRIAATMTVFGRVKLSIAIFRLLDSGASLLVGCAPRLLECLLEVVVNVVGIVDVDALPRGCGVVRFNALLRCDLDSARTLRLLAGASEIAQVLRLLAAGIEIGRAQRLLARGNGILQALRLLARGVGIVQALRLLARGVGIVQALRLLARACRIVQALRLLARACRIANGGGLSAVGIRIADALGAAAL